MEINTIITYKNDEEISICTVLGENIEPYYVFIEENIIKDYISELEVSSAFKKALDETDLIKWVKETIPYSKYTNNGLFFEFDIKEFKKSLEEMNLDSIWRKLKEVYGNDTELLEKGIYTEKSILKEYNRLMEELE